MLIAAENTIAVLTFVVQDVPIGTNISLLRVLWAMMSGSFLVSRGAIHGALQASDFATEEIRRSWAAVGCGAWTIEELLMAWHIKVAATNEWRAQRYEGYRIKAVDITGFWRPCLQGKVNKHYNSAAKKALPAVVFGIITISGESKGKRVPLLQAIERCDSDLTDTAFQVQLLKSAMVSAQPDEITVTDAGFKLSELHEAGVKNFVTRMAKNCTARQNELPEYKGRGAYPKFGTIVRPLARIHDGKLIEATPCEQSGQFEYDRRIIHHESWHNLVKSSTEVAADNPFFSIYVFRDPNYLNPLVLANDMDVKPETVYLAYKHRWPVEHPPLAAKQMIGLHRQFVFSEKSSFRLPELALLAGNILAHMAAILPPMPSGYWDRTPKATPGRLRRVLSRVNFSSLGPLAPELRKKNSVSDHLPKGILGHRRVKAAA
jgi:hypothetical protein